MAAGLAGGAEIYQLRWLKPANTTATRMRILAVYLSAAVGTGFAAAANPAIFNLFIARGWTVDGGSGTDVTPATNDCQLRTAQLPSRMIAAGGKIRISSTAALTAGTKTLDAQPVGNIVAPAALGNQQMVYQIPLYADWTTSYGIPLVLDDKEGIVIKATVPATGTWTFGVTTLFAEVE
jgi:hypothetical protein